MVSDLVFSKKNNKQSYKNSNQNPDVKARGTQKVGRLDSDRFRSTSYYLIKKCKIQI